MSNDVAGPGPARMLEDDARAEARLLWKGLIALVVVVVVAVVRQGWWV